MKKIPTLLVRNPEDRSKVLEEVNPGCEWVLAGEGVATRKYDGHGMMLDENGNWYSRREIKPGKSVPDGYILEDYDMITGKSQGWEPVHISPFVKFWEEAMVYEDGRFNPGTYELCGPKINNPEKVIRHVLIPHGMFEWQFNYPVTIEDVKGFIKAIGEFGSEGIVWHHPDGRRAKLKYQDFKEN